MRRKNLGSRIVKKAIAWAMIVMMSFSGVMSGFASMTVYAEGTEDITTSDTTNNEINNYGGEHLIGGKEFVDSSKDEYHNNEANAEKVEASSQAVKDMNAAAEEAKSAAEDAAKKVGEVQEAVQEAERQKVAAEKAKTDAAGAAESAKGVAKEAQDIVNALPTDTAQKVEDYNMQVEADQKAVDAIDNIQEVTNKDGQIIVGTVTAEDGTTEDVTLEEYVGKQADEAQKAAEEAKTKLEEALDIETDEVTQEVKDKVEEVKKAADKAAEAADKAEDAYNKAEEQKDAAIKEYNLYAMAYGLPLYGETEITYTEEEAKVVVEAAKLQYQVGKQDELQGEIDTINAATLEEQEGKIETAEKAAKDAKTAVDTAALAADIAKKNAEKAEQAISDLDDKADKAANKVNNYYVDPAQEVVDAYPEKLESKNSEIEKLTKTYEEAVSQAQQDGESAYETELGRRKDAMDIAQKNLESASWHNYLWRLAAYKKAKEAYGDYNTETAKNNAISNAVNNSDAVKEASENLNTANKELAALQEQQAKDGAVLKAAEETRDAYMKAAAENADTEARESFKAEIKKVLEEKSDAINQVDYDEDLNRFVNDCFNTWNLFEKGIIRDKMNNKYIEDGWSVLINTLGLTQWVEDTEEAEQLMDAIRDCYRQEIEQCYEKMATAEANWAAMDTEAAKEAASAEIDKIKPVITSIAGAQTAVTNAQKDIEEAQAAYKTASEDLENLKESVKDSKFDSLSLELLRSKIAAAEAAVKAAEDELKEAKAAQAAAQNYADWANALVTDHYTRAYAQALVDEDGNLILDEEGNRQFSFVNGKEFDTADEGVVSRDTKWFIEVSEGAQSNQIVPYSIYRAYVQAMYENYNYAKLEKNIDDEGKGLGISTGTITEDGEQIDGSMNVIYWEVDGNNKLTGNQIAADDLVDGQTYFVGYTFKHELDGYHIDGVLFKYTAPVRPTPGPSETPGTSPAPTTTPGGGTTPDVTPDEGGGTTVTILDDPVALAAAPVAADNGAAVLGARRTDGDAMQAAVLGARRGTEQAVLGKRRRPETGDSIALNVWMAVMTVATGAAGISGTKLAKGKKKEEKED